MWRENTEHKKACGLTIFCSLESYRQVIVALSKLQNQAPSCQVITLLRKVFSLSKCAKDTCRHG